MYRVIIYIYNKKLIARNIHCQINACSEHSEPKSYSQNNNIVQELQKLANSPGFYTIAAYKTLQNSSLKKYITCNIFGHNNIYALKVTNKSE